MARGVADIVEVVVLAAGADAFLRRGRARIGPLLQAGENILELHHAGIGEHQRRVVARHERRRRHDFVTLARKEAEEIRPDIVDAAHVRQLSSGAGVFCPQKRDETAQLRYSRKAYKRSLSDVLAAGELAMNDGSAPLPRTLCRTAAGGPLCHDRGGGPAGVLRRAGPAAQGDAAPRACRRGQRHRRRRRARAHERAGRGKHSARRRHRADPADHLPRQKPHRAAERTDGRRRARHPQHSGAHRRRPQGRRSARHQAGVRHRFENAASRPRAGCATKASCRPAARSTARPRFSSAPPTCRSIRRRIGSQRRCAARSQPARSSRRPNSAWMRRIVRRYVGALAKAGLTKQLAILIGINPLRSAKSAQWMKSHLFGTIIPDAFIARMEKAADPAREGMRICVELIDGTGHHPRRRRRAHHGAGQRRGDSASHRRSARAACKRPPVSSNGCIRRVRISTSDFSVRCTGHLSAISKSCARCSASSSPSKVITRSIWSSLPSLVSHSAQSVA